MNASPFALDHHVPTAAGKLFATELGQGAPLLLWPSIFTDHRMLLPLAQRLAADYRVILVDGPGHGRSGPPPEGMTIADCGQAILDIMDAAMVPEAALGGTSWGGLAAAHAALRAPERVSAAVLMNTPLFMNDAKPLLANRAIALGARWGLRTSLFRKGVARSFFADPDLAHDPDTNAAFHTMLRAADPKALSAAIRAVLLQSTPLAPKLGQLSVPTLMIAGEQDPMYAPTLQHVAAKVNPLIESTTVPGAHISPVDAPHQTAEAIRTFLAA